jgi:hypothetical protein
MNRNIILICIIFIVIIFFSLDIIHNKYLSLRVNEQFNNIKGAYEPFKTDYKINNNKYEIEEFISDEETLYYKQYLYKILSANNNNQIVKLILKNSIDNINLEIIFNNVLDHEKINEYDNNIAVIKDVSKIDDKTDYLIEKTDCVYVEQNIYDNNEYKWKITNITDDLKQFEIAFTKLQDMASMITIKIILNKSLEELYSDNISFNQILSPTILSNIYIIKDTEIEISSYSVSMIQFSEFTISRLNNFHDNVENILEENILDKSYKNLRRFNIIENDINKLENYYKFKKNMEKNYMTYKTLD